ncbi:MAG TPA: hypothetical protein VK680_15835 [Solirubrobacteraceae bacterium]|jgi:hypothetical protein|nr:hypothetical protein [Solirubrobacteraceae bacterium]
MKAKLATLVTALVLVTGAFGVLSVTNASARPLLCEKSGCGGKGAREYAIKYAEEEHHLTSVKIEGCMLNSQYGAQWDCWGYGYNPYNGEKIKFHIWLGEYGAEKHWTEP